MIAGQVNIPSRGRDSMPKRLATIAAVTATAAILCHAATLIKLSDAELVSHGDHILLGTVTRVSTSWEDPDGDGKSQIYTTIEVRVEQSLKGGDRPGETVTFRQLGGRIGNMATNIPGLPKFSEGDSTLLFLEGSLTNPHYSPIPGLAQGRWLVRTENDGSRFARRDFSDSTFVRLDENQPVEDVKPSEAEEVLADVIARFQKEIDKQAAEKKFNGSRQGQEDSKK
ncbi:MAG: hypothetical protein FD180_2258 [Planctomycetota bacterium]|nr:MAG: hypothetical protein FD180_2258 [Planctomycetota bacterium]